MLGDRPGQRKSAAAPTELARHKARIAGQARQIAPEAGAEPTRTRGWCCNGAVIMTQYDTGCHYVFEAASLWRSVCLTFEERSMLSLGNTKP